MPIQARTCSLECCLDDDNGENDDNDDDDDDVDDFWQIALSGREGYWEYLEQEPRTTL